MTIPLPQLDPMQAVRCKTCGMHPPIDGGDRCATCARHASGGLFHYRPANGTEFDGFLDLCFRCRHHIDDLTNPKPGSLAPPFTCCAHGILDRFMVSMVYERDHVSNWHDPADLQPLAPDQYPPPKCLRFVSKDDPNGHLTDPIHDVPGQMFFGDLPADRNVWPAELRVRECPEAAR